TVVWAAAATASGVSPARILAWMSRGRRTLSILISNWPRRALTWLSPRRTALRLVSTSRVNSTPVSDTSSRRLPSSLRPARVRWAICSSFSFRPRSGHTSRFWVGLRLRPSLRPSDPSPALTCPGVVHNPSGGARPRRDLRVRDLRGPGGGAARARRVRRARAGRGDRPGWRLPPGRPHRGHPARGAERLALPDGPGRGRADHLRLPSGRRPGRAVCHD